jgi:hypothetical protein
MNVQDELNRCMPAAAHAKLGDLLVAMIAGYNALRTDLLAAVAELQTGIVIPVVLAIKAGSSTLAKSTSAFVARVDGTAVSKAANTDMSALAGVIATEKYAAWQWYMDDAGTITTSAKTADSDTEAAALALLPATPDGLVKLGAVSIYNNQGAAAAFTGGTTALDTAGLTVTYYATAVAAVVTGTITAEEIADIDSRAESA